MYYTIYKITNNINGKVYIGKHQTSNLEDGYFGSGKHLKRAITKYGIENFTKEILHVFDNESDMNTKESELVTEEFCKRNDTYNICEGGKGGFGYINREIWTDNRRLEHNRKVSGFKKLTIEQRKNYCFRGGTVTSNKRKLGFIPQSKPPSFKGNLHTEETKKKISFTMITLQKGEKNSQYGTRWSWITDGQTNKKVPYLEDKDIPEGWKRGISKLKLPI